MQPIRIPIDVISLFLASNAPGLALWRMENNWCMAFAPIEVTHSAARMEASIDEVTSAPLTHAEAPLCLPFGLGAISYDFGSQKIGVDSKRERVTPLLQWNLYDTLLWGNADERECFFVGDVDKLEIMMDEVSRSPEGYELGSFRERDPLSIWEHGFAETQRNIFAGEIYQLNLCRQFEANYLGDPRQIFWRLFQENPAPHAAFFAGAGFHILSMSPELFLRFEENNKVVTEPIKGTRKRSTHPEEDNEQREELLASEKEAAELLMITDLLRNDLSQSCIAGSVHVDALREVQENPTVWHTFSRISGVRRNDISIAQTLFSCLPGGSISGCPKKRACEIIAELEPHARGMFCGSFGFLDALGRGQFSLLIRTLIHHQNRLIFQAGGGITAYSERDHELAELEAKCLAFFRLHEAVA